MNTGTRTALFAARIALLAGVSATALSLGFAGPALACSAGTNCVGADVVADPVPPAGSAGFTSVDGSGSYVAQLNNGALYTTGGGGAPGNDLGVSGGGQFTSSQIGNSAIFSRLNSGGLSTQDGLGNQSTVSATSLSLLDASGNMGQYAAGSASIIDASGNSTGLTSLGIIVTSSTGGMGTYGSSGFSITDTNGNVMSAVAGLGLGSGNTTAGTFGSIDNNGNIGTFNFNTSTQTFSVNAATGNVATAGTLTVTGLATLNGGAAVNGVATFTNTSTPNQGSTSINGALITLTNGSNPAQTITLNANVDPVLTVNGGTAATTTTIDNGAVTAGTSVTVGSSPANQTVINNGTITATGNATFGGTMQSHGITETAGSNIDMGGNVVHDVAAPIAGTDAANKAYVDKGVNKAFEGTALALAISQPVFMPGQTFAVRAGWGDYENQNAFGVSAAGVVAHNLFGYGSTVVVDAGVGVGSNYNGVAGKAGVTFGFGGGSAPLK